MRMVAVAGALVIALASSASSQQGPQNERADASTSSGIPYRLAVDRRSGPRRTRPKARSGRSSTEMAKGDFLLIPEGVPHQVTAFSPELYMVTFEFPRGVKAP